jgi:hypothetical protein
MMCRWLIKGVAGSILVVVGCSTGEKFVPVAGKVTVAGKPLTFGTVGFLPDGGRGNERGQASLGEIQADGSFRLLTAGRDGVPLGWYKVLVWATKDPAAAGNPWGPDGKVRKIDWLTHSKYAAQETTDLSIEVVEEPQPRHYEFDLAAKEN